MMLTPIIIATHVIEVDVRNMARCWLHGFCVPSNDPAPLIAIAGIREQADGNSCVRSKSSSGEVLAQRSPFAIDLIKTPERRRCVERLQAITHLKGQIVDINLVEADPLADDTWCNSLIMHFGKNSCIEVGELAVALKQQMISSAFARVCPPVLYLILQT